MGEKQNRRINIWMQKGDLPFFSHPANTVHLPVASHFKTDDTTELLLLLCSL